MRQTNFASSRLAYYAGLLHDIGKLNPFYQELFHAAPDRQKSLESELESKYERQHSVFSAWAAEKLLCKELDPNRLQLVLCTIAAHHSYLSNEVSSEKITDRGKRAKKGLLENLAQFRKTMPASEHFGNLDWEHCLAEFALPMDFQLKLKSKSGDATRDFVEAEVVFSSLLQADRGSFSERQDIKYDLHMDTGKLVRAESPLSRLRTGFQQWFAGVHDTSAPISVLNAPTGMGKTKVFLDLINEYAGKHGVSRVMYFSPLLALTEDFESKVAQVLGPKALDDILVYNHLFTGSLSDKQENRVLESLGYNFDNESFNSKFVISTTQRLLMILYFNAVADKMKLASLRNSLLIVDEIQVVPKFMLPNLVEMLRVICREMNAKVLLVSATIPYELSSNVPINRVPPALLREYHHLTMKKISFVPRFKPPAGTNGKKVLVMANTRKKAKQIFDGIKKDDTDSLLYVTSGIRKKDRSNTIKLIHESKKGMLVVSTQVLEAGVDVSFAEVYREVAPLDSIVQVMGRLNREGDDENPVLYIFQPDQDHRPYSELEYQESLKVLKKVRNSKELYGKLDGYYEQVSAKNLRNADRMAELERLVGDMDFEGVSSFVNNHVFTEEEGHSMIVPDTEQDLQDILAKLKSMQKFDKQSFKAYSALTANLPGSAHKEIKDYLDSDLLERGILLPRPGSLKEVYDPEVGLDKWIK